MANDSLAEEHLNMAILLFSCTTVVAIFYTFVFILYCLSIRLSYAQLRNGHGKINRRVVYTLVFQTVLLICATLDIVLKNRFVHVRFINGSDLPGGPLGLQAVRSAKTLSKTDDAVSFIENILIMGVLLWRVRVVWSGSRLMTPFTVISSFVYVISVGLALSYYVIAWQIGFSRLAATPQVQVILYETLTTIALAGSVFMTSAIIARLLSVRRNHIRVMGKSEVAGQYLGIVSMLIESYALDTVWGIGTVISFGVRYAPPNVFFNNCTIQVDIFSNFLLIYRVLSGRAWTRQTQDRLSTLRWASGGDDMTTSGTVDPRQTNIAGEDPPTMSSRNDV